VTQQEVDQYQAGYDAQQSSVVAAEAGHGSALANVQRLRDLKDFGVIVAPFDGVVTQRTAEIGQLVTAGTSMGQPLFKVAEVDTVRVFVNVPQLYAADIHVGMDAPATVRERPGRTFEGKVARTADELDVGTRTLLTEVDIPNPDGALIAGMYGQITFHIKGRGQLVLVPATAVLIDAQGTRAALVRGGSISWRKVEIEKDLGDKVAIATGLADGDVLVAGPSDRLVEGMRVRAEDSPSAQRPLAERAAKAP
jgi:RND family efflux transporter MFP subunit